MRKILRGILLVAMTAAVSSCSKTFYQVYETEASNLEELGGTMAYVSHDLNIMYDFWADGGNGCFTIRNNTDRDLFIDLSRSFMIRNGMALDYFKDRETQRTDAEYLTSNKQKSVGAAVYGLIFGNYDWYDAKVSAHVQRSLGEIKGNTETYIEKERPVICIPPHSMKVFGEYLLFGSVLMSGDEGTDYPNNISQEKVFDKGNTPVRIVNRIAYSLGEEGENIKYVENEFWVTSIANYDSDAFKNNLVSPARFYNTYEGKRGIKNEKLNNNYWLE